MVDRRNRRIHWTKEQSVRMKIYHLKPTILWISTFFIPRDHWSPYVLSMPQKLNSMFQIDQSNLHLLIPGKISWLVEYLHDDYGMSLQESLDRIYHSNLYKRLSTESTKYWHLGPVDLYEELKTEL